MAAGRRAVVALLGAGALAVSALAVPGAVRSSKGTVAQAPPKPAVTAEALDHLPIAFEANQGQADPRVAFTGRLGASSSRLFLTPEESVLKVGDDNLRMSLVGANPAPTLEGLDALQATTNYFRGTDSNAWLIGIPNYSKVSEKNVYPGVDIVWYGTGDQAEYDFVVAPGTDPGQIGLRFANATRVQLADNGDLQVRLAASEVTQRRPHAYQDVGGSRRPVDAAYAVSGSTVGLSVGKYDRTRPLVIDPVVYTKFVGGSQAFLDERARDVAVDAAGNTYVVGDGRDADFPTVNPQDTSSCNGCTDVIVYKLDPTGTTLLYSTYLSSTDDNLVDDGRAIAVDAGGNAYVTGQAGDTDFPTTAGAMDGPRSFGAGLNGISGSTTNGSTTFTVSSPIFVASDLMREIQTPNLPPKTHIDSVVSPTQVQLNNAATADGSGLDFVVTPRSLDAFVTKLSPSGSIQPADGGYSTYAGVSTDQDAPTGITVDGSGNAYVAMSSIDPSVFSNDQVAFKLNSTGTARLWSTAWGDSVANDFGRNIALDSAGNAYVVGTSSGSGFPVTAGAFQPARAGSSDATLTRLDITGTITYATYVGGASSESSASMGIAVDSSGRVYVAGSSASANFPQGSSSGFQTVLGGGNDAFVAKLDLSLAGSAQLLWSTYLGGSGSEGTQGVRLALGPANSLYIAGTTDSNNLPTASPVQGARGGGADAWAAKLNPFGNGLVWSTYLGGTLNDNGLSVAVDPSGNAYVSGLVRSANFVHSPGQAPPVVNGAQDTFVTKLTASPTPRATDFNANGTNEVAVFRPNGGTWFAHDSIGADTTQQWGVVGDAPVTGDFDGDGFSDTAIYRPSTALWAIHSSSGGGDTFVTYGTTGDIPVPADYDGDGRADIAIYRPSLGTWFVHRSSDSTDAIATFGALNSDIPVPGDYDGDGRADLGIYRDGTWFIHTATNVDASVNWGTTGDIPVAADYDGDGAADFAIYRPSTGLWAVRGTAGTNTFVTYGGIAGDVPVSADYDRDGKADIAIFRPPSGGWFVHRSSDNTDAISTWGVPTDIPLPLPIAVWSRFYP